MKLIENRRSPAAKAWLKREVSEQNTRYKRIAKTMNEELAPQRERRYAAFLERIQTRGYSVTYNQLRMISSDEIPTKPKRKSRVVF